MSSNNDKPGSVGDESVRDPLPNPEPSVPSLPEPDPGVFHHEPATRDSQSPDPQPLASCKPAPKVIPE
jgi:hypothetical protein